MSVITRNDRLRGGLMGLLVGDALGVPYEFHSAWNIPSEGNIEYAPPPYFARAHRSVPPGTWSDDGAQALCLLASLLECGRLNLDDFAQRMLRWYESGYLAVDGKVFDMGITTSHALKRIQQGHPADQGPSSVGDNGNGALMRVLPLALWHLGSDAELVRDAQLQSLPTHGHLRSQVCCALYCLWARNTLNQTAQPWPEALATLRGLYADQPAALHELNHEVKPEDTHECHGSGYVVDCLRSAWWVQSKGSYERIVRAAIALGNDTDTTACVAGGIAGIQYGVHGIPQRWRDKLRGQALYEPLVAGLVGSA
jgi:ADP-ribosylglycohydrolase